MFAIHTPPILHSFRQLPIIAHNFNKINTFFYFFLKIGFSALFFLVKTFFSVQFFAFGKMQIGEKIRELPISAKITYVNQNA